MKPGENNAPRAVERKPWSAPKVEHLASSEAEFGAGTHIDSEGMS